MKLDVDNEVIDGIVVAALREAMTNLRTDIKALKRKKTLAGYEKEDLADMVLHLDALEKTHDYFGGNLRS